MNTTSPPIPIILSMDVEPDSLRPDPHSREPWRGYEIGHAYFSQLRSLIEQRTGSPAHFSWFLRMDPQIAECYGSADWVTRRYASFLEEASPAGDLLGVHPHAHLPGAGTRIWLPEQASPGLRRDSLSTSLQTFRQAFGRPCRVIRFGYALSDALLELAEREGVRIELSLFPGVVGFIRHFGEDGRPWMRAVGSFLERPAKRHTAYFRMPRAPYRPSRGEFRRADPAHGRNLTIIPLTIAPARSLALRPLASRIANLAGSGFRRTQYEVGLSLSEEYRRSDSFLEVLNRALGLGSYLTFTTRSDLADPGVLARVRARMEILLDHPLRARFVFATPAEALALLRCPMPAEPEH